MPHHVRIVMSVEVLKSVFFEAFQLIKMMRLADFVDIFIVAFVIYKAARLIRETRAEQLIKGIVVLLLALQLSHVFRLNTINFILRNTMQVGVLAVLVVFQPELRRALEKVGRTSIGNIFSADTVDTGAAVEEIAKAVDFLSKERIGALLVLERDTKVGDLISTGTEVDALISAELLVNIFAPNTPLHDGAVIIRANKIKAAACLLPLTQNENLSRELGTRHRAALGVSEISDAAVVVVSEETGKISIALNGDMTRSLTADTLKRALLKALSPQQPRNSKGGVALWGERFKWRKK